MTWQYDPRRTRMRASRRTTNIHDPANGDAGTHTNRFKNLLCEMLL
jgi:hypothetical protein